MKNLKLIVAATLVVFASSSANVLAQPNYGDLPPIHVDGNQLRDAAGNKVVLHGVMDTPSPYFNSYRWGNSATDGNVTNCVNYFNRLFTAETDHAQGAYCNLFRLHLDPCWTNDDNVKAKGFTTNEEGKRIDPLGNEVSGEADVYHYSGAKLTKYFKTGGNDKVCGLYWRIAQRALLKGMYVIMRPPGVCPGDIQVGTYYQDYLLDVWDRVTQNDSVKKYYGHISIELANEPVRIRNAQGKESGDQRFHDFFQPIVDKIRANGFKGIIWIPGGIWQQEYKPYGKYPITDPLNNIGYAVHNYPGWFSNSDGECDRYGVSTVSKNTINSFQNSIPVVNTNPIVITEIDWSPPKPGTGHYNESGAWVESNYGTWATGSTSKWGTAYKALHDHFGNVSMTLSGSHCYFDWDTYKNSGYTKVVPSFGGYEEACGKACFDWYADWYKVNYPSSTFYQEGSYPDNPFELSNEWFKPNVFFHYDLANENKSQKVNSNAATHQSAFSKVTIYKGGSSGWRYDIGDKGLDLSKYRYLHITLSKNATKNVFFRLYDNSCNANFWGDYYALDLNGKKEFTIDLKNLTSEGGNKIDPAHIRIACFSSLGSDQTLYVSSLVLEEGEEDGIQSISDVSTPVFYSINGVKQDGPRKGVNIIKFSDGQTKKIYVK